MTASVGDICIAGPKKQQAPKQRQLTGLVLGLQVPFATRLLIIIQLSSQDLELRRARLTLARVWLVGQNDTAAGIIDSVNLD